MTTLVETSVKALPRESLTKRVADALRSEILNGNYKLGQKLQEIDLAKQFNVSSSVIREAFHILQGEGIVVIDPYRGRYVFNLSEGEYRDLVVARASMESLAAFLAAKRLEAEWGQKISAAAARFLSVQPTTYAEYVGLELDFHRAVWQAARNAWLFKQLSQLAMPLFSLNTVHYLEPDLDLNKVLQIDLSWETTNHVQGHQRLAQSILNGDPEEARSNMILHLMGYPLLIELRKQFFQI